MDAPMGPTKFLQFHLQDVSIVTDTSIDLELTKAKKIICPVHLPLIKSDHCKNYEVYGGRCGGDNFLPGLCPVLFQMSGNRDVSALKRNVHCTGS